MTEICTCQKCGTEHIVHPGTIIQSMMVVDKKDIPKLPNALSAEYQVAKAKELGYDPFRCIESVPNKDMTEFKQCKRDNGHGLGDLYCRQHAVKHPEAK